MKKLYNLFVYKPNRWYDDMANVNDTKRFLIFFIPFTVGQVTFGVLGGAWYLGWMLFLTLVYIPWRILYFKINEVK